MQLIETKGQEDEDVPLKDARTIEWCKTVSELIGTEWQYIKTPYQFFSSKDLRSFQNLIAQSEVKHLILI